MPSTTVDMTVTASPIVTGNRPTGRWNPRGSGRGNPCMDQRTGTRTHLDRADHSADNHSADQDRADHRADQRTRTITIQEEGDLTRADQDGPYQDRADQDYRRAEGPIRADADLRTLIRTDSSADWSLWRVAARTQDHDRTRSARKRKADQDEDEDYEDEDGARGAKRPRIEQVAGESVSTARGDEDDGGFDEEDECGDQDKEFELEREDKDEGEFERMVKLVCANTTGEEADRRLGEAGNAEQAATWLDATALSDAVSWALTVEAGDEQNVPETVAEEPSMQLYMPELAMVREAFSFADDYLRRAGGANSLGFAEVQQFYARFTAAFMQEVQAQSDAYMTRLREETTRMVEEARATLNAVRRPVAEVDDLQEVLAYAELQEPDASDEVKYKTYEQAKAELYAELDARVRIEINPAAQRAFDRIASFERTRSRRRERERARVRAQHASNPKSKSMAARGKLAVRDHYCYEEVALRLALRDAEAATLEEVDEWAAQALERARDEAERAGRRFDVVREARRVHAQCCAIVEWTEHAARMKDRRSHMLR